MTGSKLKPADLKRLQKVVHDPTSAAGTTTRNQQGRTHILDVAQRIVGTKGFAPVGLTEILTAARVPKGSFYHYFASKEAFGTTLLEHYFANHLAEIEGFFSASNRSARQRLNAYWSSWRENQERHDPEGKCLKVTLAAEVSSMSENMRLAMESGTSAIIMRLARVIKEGKEDGSVSISGSPAAAAHTIYELWMGATLMAKIRRDRSAFDTAVATTDRILSGKAF